MGNELDSEIRFNRMVHISEALEVIKKILDLEEEPKEEADEVKNG